MSELVEYLKLFCETDGVSGYEHSDGIATLISSEVKKYADEAYIDRAGNIIAFKKGKKKSKNKLLFAAHMDEVGFVIKHIEENGTLLFDGIGISPSSEPCMRVRVHHGNDIVNGVIGSAPVHLLSEKERKKPVTEEELFIDIGAENRDTAKKYISVGDSVSFDSAFIMLSESKIKSKALDDRIGCAVLCRLMASDLAYDTHFAFTVGEELGTLGATAAANGVKPDIVVIAEGTTAADLYGNDGLNSVCSLGRGAVLPFIDGGTAYDRGLREFAVALAAKKKIAVQTKSKIAGGTDARRFQRAVEVEGEGKGGAEVLGVALPCRYIHTASSVADANDAEAMEKLIFALADTLGGRDFDSNTDKGKGVR